MNPTELLKRVRRIQIRTAHRVSEALAGQYHSAFRGMGIEFEEVRPYQLGDDVRLIDWNVSARLGEPFIKLFREERELTVILAVDTSGSLEFGTRGQFKRELVTEIGATIAFSAIRNSDKVGLCLFTDQVERLVPARKGSRHVLRIIRELLAFEAASRRTDIAGSLEELSRMQRRRSVIFIVSDFLDHDVETGAEADSSRPAFAERSRLERVLRRLRSRHDVIPIVVDDPREREMPNLGIIELRDRETDCIVAFDTGSRRVRERFARSGAQARERRERLFRRLRVAPINVITGEDFIETLLRYFKRRERRT